MRSASRVTPVPYSRDPARFAWLPLLWQSLLVAAAAALYLLVLLQASHQDFDTYLSAGRDLLQGRPLYQSFLHHPFPDVTLRPAFIYPPVFAILVSPLSLLPPAAAGWVWLFAMQAALALTFVLFIRVLKVSGWAAGMMAVFTLTFFPLWIDAVQGQANLLVLLLAGAAILGVVSGKNWAAAALGAAGALKLTPLLLIGWLLWERKFRAAGWALFGFAALTLVGAAFRWDDTLTFFIQVAPSLAPGTGFYSNQSLSGLLARLFTANSYTQPWILLSWEPVLVFFISLAVLAWWIWHSRRMAEPVRRGLFFLPVLPLLSSITWEHHLVIVLPFVWLMIVHLARRGWPPPETLTLTAAIACFSLLARLHAGPAFRQAGFVAAQTHDPVVMLFANSLLLGCLLLFLTGPWLLRSR